MLSVVKPIIFLFIAVLMSCSQSGNDANNVQLEDLVGLWNSSENTDLMYTRISSNGDIVEYDFDGDNTDQGLNCYQVETGSIKYLSDNRFMVTTDMHAIKAFEVELEILDAGHALKIYFLDSTAEHEPGAPMAIKSSQIWTRVADSSVLEVEPSCKLNVEI